MKKLLTFALLLATMQGAWAQKDTYWTDEGNYSEKWKHTEKDTIYIDSEADLARLAVMVNSESAEDYNNGYQGYTFKLTKDLDLEDHLWVPIGDIETDIEAGEEVYPFKGCFDGQGHTIKNLYVDRDNNHENGLFGYVKGDDDHKAIITNLKLTGADIDGEGYCGGLVGYMDGNVEVSYIISDAKVSGDQYIGGIVGLANGGTIKNCFYNSNNEDNLDGSDKGAIVGGSAGNLDTSENYTLLYDGKTTQVFPVTLSLPEGVEMNWWSTPIKYLDGGYYLPGEAAMVMGPYCTSADGGMPAKRVTGLTINGVAQTLGFDGIYRHTFNAGTESGKTIAVTVENAGIQGDGTEGSPYMIYNATDWNTFANAVTNGGITFAGKHIKLGNSLTVPTMVGAEGHPFSGTFRAGSNVGNYYSLTFNCGTEALPFTEDYCAPFRYIDGATIESVKVDGNVYTSGKYAGGIVAVANGEDAHITGCRSSVVIKSIFNASAQERYKAYHGGFVALDNASLTITGSLFDGAIIANNDEYGKNTLSECGGFIGALGESANPHIIGCLVNAENNQMFNYGYTFVNHDDGNTNFTIENSYYIQPIAYAQGSRAYKVTSQAPANTAGDTYTEYPVSGFSAGTHCLRFSNAAPYTWYVGSIGLYNDSDNENLLNEFIFDTQGVNYVNVTLTGRTLFKDGNWNTLCLPFDVSAQQIDENKGGLKNATLMTLKESSFDTATGALTITFEAAESIEAGKPYIVKWAEGDNVTDPAFDVVDIVKTEPAVTETEYIDFEGTFSPVTIYQSGDKTNLYLGGDNNFYYPATEGFKVNAFRGYFKLKSGLTAGDLAENAVRAFVLDFDDDDATGIGEEMRAKNEEIATAKGLYSLDGRKFGGKPSQKGIYINNGKKTVIK